MHFEVTPAAKSQSRATIGAASAGLPLDRGENSALSSIILVELALSFDG